MGADTTLLGWYSAHWRFPRFYWSEEPISNALDYESGTPLTWFLNAADHRAKGSAPTEAYHKEMGAKEAKLKGIKSAWFEC